MTEEDNVTVLYSVSDLAETFDVEVDEVYEAVESAGCPAFKRPDKPDYWFTVEGVSNWLNEDNTEPAEVLD